jgi:hypothetical protein
VFSRRITRQKLIEFFASQPRCKSYADIDGRVGKIENPRETELRRVKRRTLSRESR